MITEVNLGSVRQNQDAEKCLLCRKLERWRWRKSAMLLHLATSAAQAQAKARRGTCGPDAPLLVADGRVAALHSHAPLPTWRLHARGGLLPADLVPARYSGHAARRYLLWVLLSPAAAAGAYRCLPALGTRSRADRATLP